MLFGAQWCAMESLDVDRAHAPVINPPDFSEMLAEECDDRVRGECGGGDGSDSPTVDLECAERRMCRAFVLHMFQLNAVEAGTLGRNARLEFGEVGISGHREPPPRWGSCPHTTNAW